MSKNMLREAAAPQRRRPFFLPLRKNKNQTTPKAPTEHGTSVTTAWWTRTEAGWTRSTTKRGGWQGVRSTSHAFAAGLQEWHGRTQQQPRSLQTQLSRRNVLGRNTTTSQPLSPLLVSELQEKVGHEFVQAKSVVWNEGKDLTEDADLDQQHITATTESVTAQPAQQRHQQGSC